MSSSTQPREILFKCGHVSPVLPIHPPDSIFHKSKDGKDYPFYVMDCRDCAAKEVFQQRRITEARYGYDNQEKYIRERIDACENKIEDSHPLAEEYAFQKENLEKKLESLRVESTAAWEANLGLFKKTWENLYH